MFIKRKNLEDKKLNLDNLSKKFHHEIKYLSQYLSFTQQLSEQKNRELEEKMYLDTESHPENESIIQQLFENEIKSLLSYYNHSAIVLIYSVLESILSDICSEVKSITSSKFSLNDLSSRNLINKSKSYLEITSNLDPSLINDEWAEIGKFQKLRNMIVHQNSSFTGDNESMGKQKKIIQCNFPTIEIAEEKRKFYILNNELATKFIALINNVISKIISHIESITYQIEPNKTKISSSNNYVPF
ncbi:hypothetical protein EGD00_07865 [Pectobacterium carotovorum subsp. carotovorum]|nr:hypothetical protein EGD00_07865 [Pectobacterium carotovorum subsp. carotovorum]